MHRDHGWSGEVTLDGNTADFRMELGRVLPAIQSEKAALFQKVPSCVST